MKDKFFLKLLALSGAHAKKSQEIFQKLDLSNGHPKVLYILRVNNGILQKDLADLCSVTPPTMTSLLSSMEKKLLIQRKKVLVSGGKRAYRIYLTDTGQHTANLVYEEFELLEKECLHGFSEQETLQIFEFMDQITNNLS